MTSFTPVQLARLLERLLPGWRLSIQLRVKSIAHGTRITITRREPRFFDVIAERDGARACGAYDLPATIHGDTGGNLVIGGFVRIVIDTHIVDAVSVSPVPHYHNDPFWEDSTMASQAMLETMWHEMESGAVALRIHLNDKSTILYEQDGLARTVTYTTSNGTTFTASPHHQVPRDRIVAVEVVERGGSEPVLE